MKVSECTTNFDFELAKKYLGKSFETEEQIGDYIREKGLEDESVKKFYDEQEKIWRKEEVTKDGKEMYNEEWVDVTDEYIERIKKCLIGTEDNRFSCGYVADVVKNELGQPIPNEYQDKHQIIFIHGGKNGSGEWKDYLQDAYNIFRRLTNKDCGRFKNAYLIKWDVDVADDVFYMWIGVN